MFKLTVSNGSVTFSGNSTILLVDHTDLDVEVWEIRDENTSTRFSSPIGNFIDLVTEFEVNETKQISLPEARKL